MNHVYTIAKVLFSEKSLFAGALTGLALGISQPNTDPPLAIAFCYLGFAWPISVPLTIVYSYATGCKIVNLQ